MKTPWKFHAVIGVIYGVWYEGYWYSSLFGLGYRTPTFQETGEEFVLIRGYLRRLKPFSAGDQPRTPPGALTSRPGT